MKNKLFLKRNISKPIRKRSLTLIALFTFIFTSVAFNKHPAPPSILQTDVWIAPSDTDKMKNPLAGDKKSLETGKALYTTYCVPCHGEKGKGDGPASTSIKTRPADHSSGKTQKQSDGAIFWKLTEGKPALDMISYKYVLSETERWSLVNYIRTLAVK